MPNLDALLQRALRHHRQGALREAEALYRRVLAARPGDAATWLRLADLLRARGFLAEALTAADRALALAPALPDAHLLRGNVLAALGRLPDAAASLSRAVALAPESGRAHNDLGCLLLMAGRPEEAVRHLERAVALEPGTERAHHHLGIARHRLGRLDEAEASLRRVAELAPGLAEAHWDRSRVLLDLGRFDDALEALDRAVSIRPGYAEAHAGRAYLLARLGLIDEADGAYREALRLRPDHDATHGNFLLFSCYHPGRSPEDLLATSKAWGDACLRRVGPAAPLSNPPDPDRPLRVGYLSPDFRGHAVAAFMEPVLRRHAASGLHVTCYASVPRPDAVTQALGRIPSAWRDIAGRPDEEVARAIRADGIDVLVDLAGYTGGGRLPVLARRPAPVQVAYLGYPATTGLATVDYRLTDPLADPPDADPFYTEALWRLAPPFFCFQPPLLAPDVGPPPVSRAEAITFGSLLNPLKINAPTLALWARVLARVPDARLLLYRHVLASRRARDRILSELGAAGVAPERVTLAWEPPPAGGHHGVYGRIDIALDTVPFCGHTTTCEALWMGVPTVTRAGRIFGGRMGVSVLTAVGLEDLVADTDDAFVAIAAGLAADPARLVALRAGLRERLLASPICDAEGFTGRIEAAYRDMWRKWCAGSGTARPVSAE